MTRELIIQRSAVISSCGKYRYRLERDLCRPGKVAALIMVNPSWADGEQDDQTIRKCIGFAGRLGIGRFIVGNKFAHRAQDVRELRTVADPVGPKNDEYLEEIMREADLHIIAWGALSKLPRSLRTRWGNVVDLADQLKCKLHCLGVAQDGHPLHPLTLGYNRELIAWKRP